MQAMKMARPTTISAELILQITLPLLLPPHADNDDHDDLQVWFSINNIKSESNLIHFNGILQNRFGGNNSSLLKFSSTKQSTQISCLH